MLTLAIMPFGLNIEVSLLVSTVVGHLYCLIHKPFRPQPSRLVYLRINSYGLLNILCIL